MGRSRTATVAAAAVALALGTAGSPQDAQAALDANCPGPSDDTDTFSDGMNPARVGQAFTAINTGALVRADIEVSKTAPASGDWVVQIVATDGAGVPTNTPLASASIPDANVPVGISLLSAVFEPGAIVEAGQRYAFALSRPVDGAFGVRERTGNPCPVQEFESTTQTGPWVLPSDVNDDIVFATFVEPDCDRDGLGDETQDLSLFGGSCPVRSRTLTLDANRNRVRKGKKVVLSGRLIESVRAGECQAGATVVLFRKKPKRKAFKPFAEVQADDQGSFSSKVKVKKTFEYRAEVAASPGCTEGVSDTEKVKAKKKKT